MLLANIYFQIIEGFNSLVPEEMQDFLNIAGVFDEVVDLLVGGPIDNSKYS